MVFSCIAAGGDTRAPGPFSSVFLQDFALKLCGFSTVLFKSALQTSPKTLRRMDTLALSARRGNVEGHSGVCNLHSELREVGCPTWIRTMTKASKGPCA